MVDSGYVNPRNGKPWALGGLKAFMRQKPKPQNLKKIIASARETNQVNAQFILNKIRAIASDGRTDGMKVEIIKALLL